MSQRPPATRGDHSGAGGAGESAPLPPPAADESLLATLLILGRRARSLGRSRELYYLAVNETHQLLPYRQSILWLNDGGVVALSGLAEVSRNTPFVQWLERLLRDHRERLASDRVVVLDALRDPASEEGWRQWLPPHLLWLPLPAQVPLFAGGGLLLATERPIAEPLHGLLLEWGEQLAHSLALSGAAPGWRQRLSAWRRRLASRVWRLLTLLVLIGLLQWPVELTILAPAELVPVAPFLVRTPMDGVIRQIHVTPNQRVAPGDRLLSYDDQALRSRLEVARQSLETARSEYRLRAQQALLQAEGKERLAQLQGEVAERMIDVDYLGSLIERGEVVAEVGGVVLIDDPLSWAGQPVVTGEQILQLADPAEVEIEAWVAPGDRVHFAERAAVRLFLDSYPLQPRSGALRYIQPLWSERPDGGVAYRLRAELTDPGVGEIGMSGTARIDGGQVALWYWLVRRPLAGLRGWLGW